ncbi:MAG TPA: SCP2 sterol-binding domain-containing protein [Polyangiales bacterium]|nr:SCP2 sterol-binding domain-containing protein [Polyangiales bacterium]
MANLFPSEGWAAEYRQAVNANPNYATAGKDWTHGPVALIVKADPSIQLDKDMAIFLDVDAGVCRGATYMPADAARVDAAFAVEGPYDNWKKLILENLDPIKALMQGKLKLTKGHLPTMIRYVESSKQLLSSAQSVATEFRR